MTKNNPANIYLLSLESEKSRISMGSTLNCAIEIISNGKSVDNFDWTSLTFDIVCQLKDVLIKENKSPSTINTYIYIRY